MKPRSTNKCASWWKTPLYIVRKGRYMVIENTLIKFGLTKDEENSMLKEVLKDKIRLREIHIDTYPENPLINSSAPFMLLLRAIEKNMIVSNDGSRLILKRNIDKFETYFMNVPFSEITECCYKTYNGCFEFILKIQNTYYRIIIFN